MEERYQPSKELGYGGFGVAWLVKDKVTGELFAVKYIERGKKASVLHSKPKSAVGTPAYIAHETAYVWSCDVLYAMLVGARPFEDPENPRNLSTTIGLSFTSKCIVHGI
ncbi:hypothetical protein Sjap_004609 [Stephania japonica]|uniref:Protein kinase domain-containing protein n=1 Tax=Stephania japonica TaxID=461633 RepID=A0AAP0K2J3_9MAGN